MFALLLLLCALGITQSAHLPEMSAAKIPLNCKQLRERGLSKEERKLIAGPILRANKNMKYECYLEFLAFIRTLNPHKFEIETKNLVFTLKEYEEVGDQIVFEKFMEAAIADWNVSKLGRKVGCSFTSKRIRPAIFLQKHKVTCIFSN